MWPTDSLAMRWAGNGNSPPPTGAGCQVDSRTLKHGRDPRGPTKGSP